MKPFRNIYVRTDELTATSQMTGTLDIPYTGQVFYDIITDDGVAPDGYNPETDIYYRCTCEFKEIKSFVKI
jgi:hypothetical protein